MSLYSPSMGSTPCLMSSTNLPVGLSAGVCVQGMYGGSVGQAGFKSIIEEETRCACHPEQPSSPGQAPYPTHQNSILKVGLGTIC